MKSSQRNNIMKTKKAKPLRCVLDRSSSRPYVRQLMDAIRDAIEMGYYRDGDILPSLEEMAEAANVSIIVPREAIARLAKDGLVVPRRGVGCIVRSPDAVCRGHVLLVTSELVDNRYVASICATIRKQLVCEGYQVLQVSVVRDPYGKPDYGQLNVLLRSSVTLVVSFAASEGVRRYVLKSGVPVVFVDNGCSKLPSGSNVVGKLPWSRFSQLTEFVEHCVRFGVRHVTEVTADNCAPVAVSALNAAGVLAEVRHCSIVRSFAGENCVEPQMFKLMRALCRARKGHLRNELFFFSDDIAARAALMAFLVEGVRIPEDVYFVSWCIRGFEPLSAVPLTRLESDPCAVGLEYSRYILGVLQGDANVSCQITGNCYVIGETFPDGKKKRRRIQS